MKLSSVWLLIALPIGASLLQAHEIEIRGATEIEFETNRGHYYQLQHSTNLTDWIDIDDRVYGHGGRERRLRSAHSDDKGVRVFFRLQVTDAPTNGYAPASFSGVTLQLDDSPGGDTLRFLTETNGVSAGNTIDAFIYQLTATGPNEVRVETHPPTYNFDRRDVYQFAFTAANAGTWVRDEYRRGQLKDRDTGAFRFADNSTPVPSATTPLPPTDPGSSTVPIPADLPQTPPVMPTGLTFTFLSGTIPERLVFKSDTTGIEYDDSAPTSFSYVYTSTGEKTFQLRVQLKADKWDEYDLSFTGGAAGSFVRREFDRNLLKDRDMGRFTVAPSITH